MKSISIVSDSCEFVSIVSDSCEFVSNFISLLLNYWHCSLGSAFKILESEFDQRFLSMNNLAKNLKPLFSNLKLFEKRWFSSEIFISRLSFYTTDDELREVFSRYGNVQQVRLIRDGKTQKLKGFGFVDYSSEEEAWKAVKAMDGKILNGRLIFVEMANSKSGSDVQ